MCKIWCSYSLNNVHEGGDLEIPNLVAPNEQAITTSHLGEFVKIKSSLETTLLSFTYLGFVKGEQ